MFLPLFGLVLFVESLRHSCESITRERVLILASSENLSLKLKEKLTKFIKTVHTK